MFSIMGVNAGQQGEATIPVQGERIAGFILITGIDGIRYAVRQHAVSVLSDHDPAQDETCVVLHWWRCRQGARFAGRSADVVRVGAICKRNAAALATRRQGCL
jgi:hypothetical protein